MKAGGHPKESSVRDEAFLTVVEPVVLAESAVPVVVVDALAPGARITREGFGDTTDTGHHHGPGGLHISAVPVEQIRPPAAQRTAAERTEAGCSGGVTVQPGHQLGMEVGHGQPVSNPVLGSGLQHMPQGEHGVPATEGREAELLRIHPMCPVRRVRTATGVGQDEKGLARE